jgi:peptidyl-prolyl cis-trans isomerase C
MNSKSTIFPIFLLAVTAAGAQVASHAPTALKQAPVQAPASLTSSAPTAKPVVRVNGTVLTEADLVREEYAIFPYARQHNGVPKELESEVRSGAMKMIVFEELVYQEALRRKIVIPAARIQKSEMDFRKTFSTPEEFTAFMQSEFHGSRELLDAKIRRSLLIDALLRSEVALKSVVTPADVRAYYDKNPDRFRKPETFIFQTISVIPPEKATDQQIKEGRARIEKALVQAKATKTNDEFGLLAEKASDDDYRVMEGQHKATPAEQLPPQVVKALKAMKVGDVSGIIQVDLFFTILRLNAHTPAGLEKFEDVRTKLTADMKQAKTNHVRAAFDSKLRQNATVETP